MTERSNPEEKDYAPSEKEEENVLHLKRGSLIEDIDEEVNEDEDDEILSCGLFVFKR